MKNSNQTFNVRVIPRARKDDITVDPDGTLRVHTTAVPTDGAANDAVIKIIAKHFDVAKSQVKIICGATSRNKIIQL